MNKSRVINCTMVSFVCAVLYYHAILRPFQNVYIFSCLYILMTNLMLNFLLPCHFQWHILNSISKIESLMSYCEEEKKVSSNICHKCSQNRIKFRESNINLIRVVLQNLSNCSFVSVADIKKGSVVKVENVKKKTKKLYFLYVWSITQELFWLQKCNFNISAYYYLFCLMQATSFIPKQCKFKRIGYKNKNQSPISEHLTSCPHG